VTVTQTPPAIATKPAAVASNSVTEKSAASGPKVLAPEQPAAPAEKQIAALTPPSEPASAAPAANGGSVMIQLGSFPNDALAASAWSKIKMANQELLGSYSPSIKPAEIPGKGTWYRLRVGGFADKGAAKSVCDQLSANGQACIVAAK
jgi:cell division septation protein DedD